MPRSRYILSRPWDGSGNDQYRAIAAAVGCSAYAVREWARQGSIPNGLLAFLEHSQSPNYRPRSKGRSTKPNPPKP